MPALQAESVAVLIESHIAPFAPMTRLEPNHLEGSFFVEAGLQHSPALFLVEITLDASVWGDAPNQPKGAAGDVIMGCSEMSEARANEGVRSRGGDACRQA